MTSGVFEAILPLFILILLGYVAGERGWCKREGVRIFSGFVYYLAVPVMLFRLFATGVANMAEDLTLLWIYYGVGLSLYSLIILVARFVFSRRLAESALMALSGIYSNTVLLGIPVILAVFGEAGLVPLLLIISFHTMIFIPLTTLLTQLEPAQLEPASPGAASGSTENAEPGQRARLGLFHGVFRGTAKVLGPVITNPIIIALLAGLLYGATGWPLPGLAVAFADLINGATVPCALFALGASLAGFSIAGDLRDIAALVAVKLVLYPLMMAAVVFGLADLPPLWAKVAVVSAAMPVGLNVFVLASQNETFLARSASCVALSTGLSLASLTVLIWFLDI